MKQLLLILSVITLSACIQRTQPSAPSGIPTEITTPQTLEDYDYESSAPAVIHENLALAQNRAGITNIAIFLPLSGNGAHIGQSMKKAIQLALTTADQNKIRYQFFDTQSSVSGTKKAFAQASSYGIDIILGPLYAQNVKTLKSETSIPMITFTTDETAISQESFSLGITPKEEVRNLKKFIHADKKLVALLPNNQMGRMYNNELDDYGIRPEQVSFYTPSDLYTVQQQIKKLTGFERRKAELDRMKSTIESNNNLSAAQKKSELKKYENRDTISGVDFDSILVIGDTEDVKGIVSYLRYFEVDPKKVDYIGTSIMSNDKILTDPNFTNINFVSPLLKNKKSFTAQYEKTFNQTPHSLSSQAYDAAKLIQELSKQGFFDKTRLTQSSGFNGLNGIFRFDYDGTTQYQMDLYQITGRGTYRIKEKSENF